MKYRKWGISCFGGTFSPVSIFYCVVGLFVSLVLINYLPRDFPLQCSIILASVIICAAILLLQVQGLSEKQCACHSKLISRSPVEQQILQAKHQHVGSDGKIEPREQQRIIFEVVVNRKELDAITVAIETLHGDMLTTLHSLAQWERQKRQFLLSIFRNCYGQLKPHSNH